MMSGRILKELCLPSPALWEDIMPNGDHVVFRPVCRKFGEKFGENPKGSFELIVCVRLKP